MMTNYTNFGLISRHFINFEIPLRRFEKKSISFKKRPDFCKNLRDVQNLFFKKKLQKIPSNRQLSPNCLLDGNPKYLPIREKSICFLRFSYSKDFFLMFPIRQCFRLLDGISRINPEKIYYPTFTISSIGITHNFRRL